MRTAALACMFLLLTIGGAHGQDNGPYSQPPPPQAFPGEPAFQPSSLPIPPMPLADGDGLATISVSQQAPEPAPSADLPPPTPLPPQGGGLPNLAAPPQPDASPAPPPSLPGLPGSPGPGGLPYKSVWGLTDLRIFPDARRVSPNGVPFHPISTLDLNFNLWLWPRKRLYAFGLSRFWVQQDDNQTLIEGPRSVGKSSWVGIFNWAKREFDLTVGGAWNYYGHWEARVFAYSMNNLNRGDSFVMPKGFNDGMGVENRYYLSSEYDRLGQDGFDISRATFVSIGYEPSKVLMGLDGVKFKPGPFAEAYLIYDLSSLRSYLFSDIYFLGNSNLRPKQLYFDGGLAITPIRQYRMLEIRLGTEIVGDYQDGIVRSNWLPYLQGRLNF